MRLGYLGKVPGSILSYRGHNIHSEALLEAAGEKEFGLARRAILRVWPGKRFFHQSGCVQTPQNPRAYLRRDSQHHLDRSKWQPGAVLLRFPFRSESRQAVLLIATNPVDVMAQMASRTPGIP